MTGRVLVLLLMLVVSSPSVTAQVASTDAATPPSGPIVRAALDPQSAVPGQAVVLTLTVLVPTWMAKPPQFPSIELDNVAVRRPPDSSGAAGERIGQTQWSGVRRQYYLYPLAPGRYRIPAQTIQVVAAHPDTRKPIASTVQSEELFFEVAAPPGAEALTPFIAAKQLVLTQRLEPAATTKDDAPITLAAGDALTRIVTATIAGGPAMAIPPLIPPLASPGLAVYPKEPIVEETTVDGVISGSRSEQVTYVGEHGGHVDAPPIQLRWYSIESEQVETAQLPGFTIAVDAPLLPPGTDWRDLAPWLALATLVMLLIGVAAVRVWPRLVTWQARRREAYVASEAYAYKRIRSAVRAKNLGTSLSAIERWSKLLPAGGDGEDAQLSTALAQLGALNYSNDRLADSRAAWSALSAALSVARRRRRAEQAAREAASALPPLNLSSSGL